MGLSEDWRYSSTYEEALVLEDGTELKLRMIGPDDKARLREGFERMSPESRYNRFFTDKRHLDDAELRYLTEVDGVSHVAIVALHETEEGVEGVGIGRFIRSTMDPGVAEPAIAVVDSFHRRGIGTVLLHRLVEAAIERGICRFEFDIRGDNTDIRGVIDELSPEVVFTPEETGVLHVEVPLPTGEPEALSDEVRASALHRLLVSVARRVVRLVFGSSSTGVGEDVASPDADGSS